MGVGAGSGTCLAVRFASAGGKLERASGTHARALVQLRVLPFEAVTRVEPRRLVIRRMS